MPNTILHNNFPNQINTINYSAENEKKKKKSFFSVFPSIRKCREREREREMGLTHKPWPPNRKTRNFFGEVPKAFGHGAISSRLFLGFIQPGQNVAVVTLLVVVYSKTLPRREGGGFGGKGKADEVASELGPQGLEFGGWKRGFEGEGRWDCGGGHGY